jgi:alpha-glucosidase
LGSITNEEARDFDIDLSFLGEGKYEAQIYADGEGVDIDHNPANVAISKQEVRAADTLKIHLGAGGGTAVRFKKL